MKMDLIQNFVISKLKYLDKIYMLLKEYMKMKLTSYALDVDSNPRDISLWRKYEHVNIRIKHIPQKYGCN